MRKLVKKYKAKILKHNYGECFLSEIKIYKKKPTEKELNIFLDEFNKLYEQYENFETTIELIEYWIVDTVNLFQNNNK